MITYTLVNVLLMSQNQCLSGSWSSELLYAKESYIVGRVRDSDGDESKPTESKRGERQRPRGEMKVHGRTLLLVNGLLLGLVWVALVAALTQNAWTRVRSVMSRLRLMLTVFPQRLR